MTTPTPAQQKYIDAAQALADRGEAVTLAAVRREAGGGSMNTITDAVRMWRETQAEDQAPRAVMIPESVQEANARALAVVWQEAQAQHRAALEAEREALDAERLRIEAERAEALELARQFEAETEQVRRELAAARDEVEKLAAAVARERQAAAGAEARAEERADQVRGLREELKAAGEQAARARDEAAELRGRLAALESSAKAAPKTAPRARRTRAAGVKKD